MERKIIAFSLLFSFTTFMAAPDAYAKSEKAAAHSNGVMPALPVQGMQGYETAKKALEDPGAAHLLKQEVAAARQAVDALRAGLRRLAPQKGDPKTTYIQSQNKMHSAKHRPAPVEVVEGWTPLAQNTDPETGNILVQYEPPAGSPSTADYIVVEYSKAGEPLTATSYTTVVSTAMPDVSAMTLVHRDELLSGEVIETYGYPVEGEDLSGVTKWSVLFYDADGNFSKAVGTYLEEVAL